MQVKNIFRWLLQSLFAVLLLLFISSFALNIEVWQTITLYPKITVKLPGTPTIESKASTVFHQVQVKDSFEVQAMVIDYGVLGLDEGVLDSLVKKDIFSNQIIAFIQEKKDTLISNNKGMHQRRYRYFEIVYKTKQEDFEGTIYQRYVFYKQLGLLIVFKVPKRKNLNTNLHSQVYQSLNIEE